MLWTLRIEPGDLTATAAGETATLRLVFVRVGPPDRRPAPTPEAVAKAARKAVKNLSPHLETLLAAALAK
jgi:hypothetical protein